VIKTVFSKSLPAGERRSPGMSARGERGIWQRRYWEHTIRDERDYAAHMDYTHFNPVKHGLVEQPADWPFSSFRRCVERGVYPTGWMRGGEEPGETGERGVTLRRRKTVGYGGAAGRCDVGILFAFPPYVPLTNE
jgi:putative transposase